jgi:transposase
MMQSPEIELWAMDEVILQLHGTTCKTWIAPEDTDPVVFHNPVKKNVRYYGAVRLCDGKVVYQREMNTFNGDSCHTFLKYLRKITARSSKKTVILADRAPYHRARVHKDWREACSDKFSLEFLPPYSPELNPIERVWKFTRRACTHNIYFPAIDDIVTAVEPQFDQWRNRSETLQSLCAVT